MKYILSIIIRFCSKLLGTFLKKHVYIREIRDSESYDAQQFVDLYYKTIPKDLQISAQIILDFVDNEVFSNIIHHLFVCKRNGKVVGFLKIMICERHHYMFIAYLGVDKEDLYARSKGVKKLMKKAVKDYADKMKLDVIAEISNTQTKDLAMRRLVRKYSKIFKRIAYTVNAEYIQPTMPDTYGNSTVEEKLTLLFVPFLHLSNNIMQKEELYTLVSSVYYDIYSPSCNVMNGCNTLEYNKYLCVILEKLNNMYDKIINLNQC